MNLVKSNIRFENYHKVDEKIYIKYKHFAYFHGSTLDLKCGEQLHRIIRRIDNELRFNIK